MTHDHSALLAQLDALVGADAGSVFAELIRAGLQALIDVEATAALGAGRYERTAERTDYRNGTRSKIVATTSGTSKSRFRSCVLARSFRVCSSGGGGSIKRCMR
jgi:transposase-like protein